jgi:hypothetical protein
MLSTSITFICIRLQTRKKNSPELAKASTNIFYIFRLCMYFVLFISVLVLICYIHYNYTLYKNPGFWLVNSRCIVRVFSYLGLISFIFTAAGVFAWGFNIFTLACIKTPSSFGIFLLYLYTKSNVINQIWNPEVFRSIGFNFFSLCRGICENVFHFFTLTCRKPPNSFGILQPLSNKTNRNKQENCSRAARGVD